LAKHVDSDPETLEAMAIAPVVVMPPVVFDHLAIASEPELLGDMGPVSDLLLDQLVHHLIFTRFPRLQFSRRQLPCPSQTLSLAWRLVPKQDALAPRVAFVLGSLKLAFNMRSIGLDEEIAGPSVNRAMAVIEDEGDAATTSRRNSRRHLRFAFMPASAPFE
jgi:hypothetical protein